MSVLPEREAGIFRMAHALGWSNPHVVAHVGPGLSTSQRVIDRFVIDVEYTSKTKDPATRRWLLRISVKIAYEGLPVFYAWQSKLVGFYLEPNAGVVVDFLPGPWETHLAALWKAEKQPS